MLTSPRVKQTTIIAILCNGYHESAGTFSPTQGQIGGGGGFGIWQWTGNARQGEIVSYARTHSEKDAIKWQCNFLVDNRPNQWIAKAGLLWNDFLHNTPNRDWKWLTWCFCVSWERPGIPLMNSRYAAYDKSCRLTGATVAAGAAATLVTTPNQPPPRASTRP